MYSILLISYNFTWSISLYVGRYFDWISVKFIFLNFVLFVKPFFHWGEIQSCLLLRNIVLIVKNLGCYCSQSFPGDCSLGSLLSEWDVNMLLFAGHASNAVVRAIVRQKRNIFSDEINGIGKILRQRKIILCRIGSVFWIYISTYLHLTSGGTRFSIIIVKWIVRSLWYFNF